MIPYHLVYHRVCKWRGRIVNKKEKKTLRIQVSQLPTKHSICARLCKYLQQTAYLDQGDMDSQLMLVDGPAESTLIHC